MKNLPEEIKRMLKRAFLGWLTISGLSMLLSSALTVKLLVWLVGSTILVMIFWVTGDLVIHLGWQAWLAIRVWAGQWEGANKQLGRFEKVVRKSRIFQ